MNARFADKFVWDVDELGRIRATSSGDLPIGGGKKIPIAAKSILGNAAAGAAIIKGIARYSGPLGIGISLWDLANELDVNLTRGQDGAVSATHETGEVWSGNSGGTSGGACYQVGGADAAMKCSIANSNSTSQSNLDNCTGGPSGSTGWVGSCRYIPTGTYLGGGATRNSEATSTQISMPDLADLIASQSGWPSGSKMPDAIRDVAGLDVPFDVPAPTTITGPATSPGGVVTTTNNAGDVITTTTTNNHNYSGATVTNTTTAVTTNYNNATSTTTTTTTEKEADKPAVEFCEKNPESIACAKPDVPEHEVPKRTVDVSFAAEDLGFGGGSCPAPVSFDVTTGHYELSFSSWCDALTTWVRPLVIALATLMAFMIAWPRSES